MSAVAYFAYGSNLLPQRLVARIGHCALLGYASLGGFRLAFNKRGADGSAKCNVERTDEVCDVVHGAVYGISLAQRARLDRFEGVGRGYELANAHATVFTRWSEPAAGDSRELVLYAAMPDHVAHDLRPFSWYLEFVLFGARAHAMPHAYVERIAAIASDEDPDPGRSSRNRAVRDAAMADVLARFEADPGEPRAHF